MVYGCESCSYGFIFNHMRLVGHPLFTFGLRRWLLVPDLGFLISHENNT